VKQKTTPKTTANRKKKEKKRIQSNQIKNNPKTRFRWIEVK